MNPIAARIAALLTVVACFPLPYVSRQLGAEWNHSTIALMGTIAVIILHDGNVSGLGFRRTPLQGWWYWGRMALWLGLWVALIVIVFGVVAFTMSWTIPIYRANPQFLLHYLFFMCLYAPLIEEIVYRSLLAVALHSTLGDQGLIVVSGLVFAAVHWAYGNPSPENQIGGFLLAWAFVRSKTILVPLAMHSAGNLVALMVQVINWYVL